MPHLFEASYRGGGRWYVALVVGSRWHTRDVELSEFGEHMLQAAYDTAMSEWRKSSAPGMRGRPY